MPNPPRGPGSLWIPGPSQGPDLLWDVVRSHFDPEANGALPDVRVAGVSGWQTVFDLVRARGWWFGYEEHGAPLPLPQAVDFPHRFRTCHALLRVRPVPDAEVIFRPYTAEDVDFDVDLREFQGQDRLNVLCDLYRTLGRALRRPVAMYAEGSTEHPFLIYEPSSDRFSVAPP